MRPQHFQHVLEVRRIARPVRVPEPSPIERMAQLISLRALMETDLEFHGHELAGVLLDEDEADAEVRDVGEFVAGEVVVPFSGC